MDPHSNIVPTLTINKEETNPEMAGGNSLYVNRHTSPYYLRCKRPRQTNIESLPDDLVFNILLQVPAQDIYDVARVVCRKWYNVIHTYNFIDAHFQRSTSGLVVHNLLSSNGSIFVELQKGRIEISKLNYKFQNKIRGGCNGLIIHSTLDNTDKNKVLHIANPAAKQRFLLPPFCLGIIQYYVMAYVAASKEYKVFLTYH